MNSPDASHSDEFPYDDVVSALPHAFGEPGARGVLRARFEDFVVDEQLPVEPDGSGEHVLLQVRKTGLNTQDVVQRLSRFSGVRQRDIGFAGQKDRNAVTTQWFSLLLINQVEPDWSGLDSDAMQVLQAHRHGRKLKRGALRANRFQLTVRDFDGDPEDIAERIDAMRRIGMPNYFGAQRFGRRGSNLYGALRMFTSGKRPRQRNRAGMMLSAARSLLFNQVLAERVRLGNWATAIAGDYMALDGSRSGFVCESPDAEIAQRLAAFDIHPSGPLYGDGPLKTQGEALALETRVLADWPEWRTGLENARASADRRALRARVADLEWALDGDSLRLSFELPRGSFATALVRELLA